ncbi:hypothetical protein [Enhygromyxa salina]|uniref:Endonuclease/exonuclease/phosphatase domain-containing protein n=1 Tax=Enhygromyxa salina TaxID=215803 RepID=A0A2S9XT80_9BACT|nr:hypothetical protein [Enhygromyxa salina]PRP96076.1 hypothetical protein ENSA7_68900 [Enhygromyxa salina]
MNTWKCSNCSATATAYLAPICHGQKMHSTTLVVRKRKFGDITPEKIEPFVPRKKRKFVVVRKAPPAPKWNSMTVLFIPFDAGGVSRTKKGLLEKGSRGEVLLSDQDSFFRLPYDEGFLNKRDFTMMREMEESDMVKVETQSKKGLLFRPDTTDKMMEEKVKGGRFNWNIEYDKIAEQAVSGISSEHDRKWEKKLFLFTKTGKVTSHVKCACTTSHFARADRVPRAFPDIIFLSEELKYNQFPDQLDVFGVAYVRQSSSALTYNKKGSPKDWKQQISCYVRTEHRSSHEQNAVFTTKPKVTDNKESVLVLTKKLGGVKLAVCGVHFSSKYVGQCKNNSSKGRLVLKEKLKWSEQEHVDVLIGDFNFDCSFDSRFITEYVSGPQFIGVGESLSTQRIERVVSTRASNTSQAGPLRFMNAVVTNDETIIHPNSKSGEARPLVGNQSTEDGYYSDHPWVFVAVGKRTSDLL